MDYMRGRYGVDSNPLRSQRQLELLLVVLGVLLVLQLLYSGARLALGGAPDAVSPAADALQVSVLQKNSVVGEQESTDIRARPLFWYSRRPLEQLSPLSVDEPVVGKVTELKSVKLLGVFGSGEDAGIIALVKDKKQRILLGEKLNGWTLHSVEPNSIILRDGTRQEQLVLKQGIVVAAAPVPVAAKPVQGGKATATPGGNDKAVVPDKPQVMAPPNDRRVQRGG